MARQILLFIVFILSFSPAKGAGDQQWYKCTVNSSSHTGYYTFKVSQASCSMYWLEIDTQLKVKSCELPEITAYKPSARDEFTVVWINLKTGQFYDYLSGVYDRGICRPIVKP